MSPIAEPIEDTSDDCAADQSQSSESEDTRTTSSGRSSSASWEQRSSLDGFSVIRQAIQASCGTGSSNTGASASFSVINYVGKVQKQSSHRSTGRSRTPYERPLPSRPSQVESIDETTSSSLASSIDGSSSAAGDSVSLVGDVSEIVDLDESTRAAGDQLQQQNMVQQPQQQQHLHHGPRRRRSGSVSSSGCSSSMDDRNCGDLSPFGSMNSCRCTSFSVSDFDDDGFREDVSVSSAYSVISSSRQGYQPHHPLHHNHQNVPHHPSNTKGLFDIALKTVKLIQRNQELQLRLAQLQEETKAFVESVMANPENESLRNHYQKTGSSSSSSGCSTIVVQK